MLVYDLICVTNRGGFIVGNHHSLKDVIPSYVVYMGLFIGTGFLSGAIVHLPLNPVRFAIIGLIGAAILLHHLH